MTAKNYDYAYLSEPPKKIKKERAAIVGARCKVGQHGKCCVLDCACSCGHGVK